MIQSSVSTLSFVVQTYKNPPECKAIEDFTTIHVGLNEAQFADNLVYSFNNGILCHYIGNALISIYKTEDPAMQSLWNSDTTRLTYIVSHLIDENDRLWKIDKKGLEIDRIIIKPVLTYISKVVVRAVQSNKPKPGMYTGEIREIIDKNTSLNLIKKSIDMGTLDTEILKYIAPSFRVVSSDKQIEQVREINALKDPKKILEHTKALKQERKAKRLLYKKGPEASVKTDNTNKVDKVDKVDKTNNSERSNRSTNSTNSTNSNRSTNSNKSTNSENSKSNRSDNLEISNKSIIQECLNRSSHNSLKSNRHINKDGDVDLD